MENEVLELRAFRGRKGNIIFRLPNGKIALPKGFSPIQGLRYKVEIITEKERYAFVRLHQCTLETWFDYEWELLRNKVTVYRIHGCKKCGEIENKELIGDFEISERGINKALKLGLNEVAKTIENRLRELEERMRKMWDFLEDQEKLKQWLEKWGQVDFSFLETAKYLLVLGYSELAERLMERWWKGLHEDEKVATIVRLFGVFVNGVRADEIVRKNKISFREILKKIEPKFHDRLKGYLLKMIFELGDPKYSEIAKEIIGNMKIDTVMRILELSDADIEKIEEYIKKFVDFGMRDLAKEVLEQCIRKRRAVLNVCISSMKIRVYVCSKCGSEMIPDPLKWEDEYWENGEKWKKVRWICRNCGNDGYVVYKWITQRHTIYSVKEEKRVNGSYWQFWRLENMEVKEEIPITEMRKVERIENDEHLKRLEKLLSSL